MLNCIKFIANVTKASLGFVQNLLFLKGFQHVVLGNGGSIAFPQLVFIKQFFQTFTIGHAPYYNTTSMIVKDEKMLGRVKVEFFLIF